MRVQTLLIVDDHAGFRGAARRLLHSEGFEIAGEAADGQSALAQIENLHPDVVLLDIQLPDVTGFDLAEKIATMPTPPAVVLTSSRSPSAARVGSCPVRGFIAKTDLSAERLDRLVRAGP